MQAHLGRYLEQQWMQRQRSPAGAHQLAPASRRRPPDLRRGLDLTRSIALKRRRGGQRCRPRPARTAGTRVDVAASVSDARSEALGYLVAAAAPGSSRGVGVVVGSAQPDRPRGAPLSVPLHRGAVR